ncbi:hypothetical protein PTTG_29789 [Puccinia triticina 1-1 BBBD Race 1]|uniref:Uncharacterized protein n=1 Tax=Puccinia triticina (isolate 1-1 / race 1 (BBBD)) TaxID=630390 RepID=A0A180G2K5_PUCT1|nr:hypothetical protein PTTG_29789 [Puccinia triticina 1-1 BBBD Race 1]
MILLAATMIIEMIKFVSQSSVAITGRSGRSLSSILSLAEVMKKYSMRYVVQAVDTFAQAMLDLADACGENSLIKLGDKLFALIHLDYAPGSSIGDHINKFQSMYTSLKSAQLVTKNMQVNTAMAGMFFLKSFRYDDSLAPLIQTLFDVTPFTFEKLATRMNIEHSRADKSGSLNA